MIDLRLPTAPHPQRHSTIDMGECDPIKIEEYNNFSDPQTKYLVYRVWMRHLHYTHNLAGSRLCVTRVFPLQGNTLTLSVT